MASTRSGDRDLIATTSSLVDFLRDIALARRRRILDVAGHESVLWLADLPAEVGVNTDAGPGEVLFAVARLRAEAPPEPPAALTNWLDRAALGDSAQPSPVLKEKGPAWVEVEHPDGTSGVRVQAVAIDDAPDVGRAFESWLPVWHAWAARDRAAAPLRHWYTSLVSAGHLVAQQEDQYEIVLGTGLLAWRGTSGAAVRNHLLTTRLVVTVDGERDEVRVVVDPDGVTRAQDRELLDGDPAYDPHRVEAVHDQVRDGSMVAPLVDAEALLRQWADRALDVETPYIVDNQPPVRAGAQAEVRLAPAVVLRRRERASLIGYYDEMLRALRGPTARAPLGLAQLVTAMEADERLAWLSAEGARSGEVLGSDPLFPLPANPEQLRIMQRLRENNGVVVQGPPGTGKTHTIANLTSALLAQGQRVLVTSQKAQALRVLREKLPPEVAKLCVSVTDLDRGGSAELEGSVKAMSARYAGFDPVRHDDEVSRSEQRRTDLAARVVDLTAQVRSLREAELQVHPEVAPGYAGTLADIAGRLRANASRHGWMPGPVPQGVFDPPLTAAEASELLSLLTGASTERAARLHQAEVELGGYPSGGELRSMVDAERAAQEAARQGATEVSRQLDGCDDAVLRELRGAVEAARQASSLLGLDADTASWPPTDWAVVAVADGLAGRNATIWDQLAAGRDQVSAAQRAVQALGFREVVVGEQVPGTAPARLARVAPLRDYLAGGGKLRGAFRPAVQRDAESVLADSRVDGVPVTSPEQIALVASALEAQACVETLGRGWALVGVDLTGPAEEAVQRSVARVVDVYGRLELVHRLLGAVARARQTLAGAESWVPLADVASWQEFVDALDAVRLRVEAEQASAALRSVADQLTRDARGPHAPPELARAASAVAARDTDAFARALAELGEATQQRADQLAADGLLERLRAGHPALAALMVATPTDAVWPQRLGAWESAWAWARAHTFFEHQRQPGREQQLEAELSDTVTRLRQETAQLAAALAWGHCLRRMTARQAQALQSYEQHMRQVGKGTGRYAGRFRGLARSAMREARDAVPAWIMPLDVVLETLAPVRDSFDVVIVDEASQASLEDLFLLWLAPRVIVVGDDKQCAPSQVRLGELEPIFAKLSSYLPELPPYLRDAYTPRSSLFDLLRTRFGAVIPLREHFRCMPEIIEYSSRQFYADEPLVPLRQFGADRLPPLRAVRVEGASTQGTSTRLVNPVEAEAVVAQIEACVADPAYHDRTFGVVVLQGTGQVQLIHQLLLERIEPREWQRRRLRVGTPPDFQGDERDVIFISMVVAEKRPAVTGTEWQRRFNVAGSRAKDQLWLFHSVGLGQLTPTDLRASLLSYVLNPPPVVLSAGLTGVSADDPHPAFRSLFDQRVFLRIQERGFPVTPGVEVNGRLIDLVVTGAKGRLAVECDGHAWPGTPAQREADLDRERELKRAGWRFWRIRESEFQYDPDAALATLWETLERLGIRPLDPAELVGAVDTATVWRPAPLSVVEGLDGLDGGEPTEIDDVVLTPNR